MICRLDVKYHLILDGVNIYVYNIYFFNFVEQSQEVHNNRLRAYKLKG